MANKNPYQRDIVQKCDVCGRIVFVDQFGNGVCESCGWVQSANEEQFEMANKISYPNLVPLSVAKEQYAKGLPFTPSFEDFLNGLLFYSEMEFDYNNKHYGVFYYTSENVEFFEVDVPQSLTKFKNIKDFADRANIDGHLLKDIWKHVKNARFMQCG